MANDTEITKVRIVIRHLLWQIREVRKDKDAAWQWVNRFANTLEFQDLETDPDQYALAILAEARSFNDQQRRKGQMLGVRKQLAKEGIDNPTQEQLDEKWLEMYGNETTADAPTRENGKKGGRPRKDATTPDTISTDDNALREGDTGPVDSMGRTDAPSRTLPLPTWESFLSFVDGEGLDYSDAREWWEMTMVDRKGLDRYGKPIGNWKGALKRFCKSKTERRSA